MCRVFTYPSARFGSKAGAGTQDPELAEGGLSARRGREHLLFCDPELAEGDTKYLVIRDRVLVGGLEQVRPRRD